ncbi:MAG: imidazolonepropionase [Ignavibacteria bacterium CG2_30_36_16]|nr:imidazolonepropionase [Ignavibacteria bacterium]OIP56653.1 MAG: imidazolonepropionase [Ignavibacteria bacterium CG2_30_36_16]PJB01799.1 MAG: imidazolonepropionase [Ignavibacteria bacterium CG_4_9_14_3_um_filter_36_18]
MITLFKNPAQIITVDTKGKNYKRGSEMNDIFPLFEHSIVVEDGLIKDFIPNSYVSSKYENEIDLSGRIVLPGLVECHTHTAFAGSRAEEFRLKLKGVDYEEIAKKEGGINKTVTSVREISEEEFYSIVEPRIKYFISQGITTLEIKSGYGLNFENEIKILRLIKKLNDNLPIDIVSTFLGAHTFPKEFKTNHQGYVDEVINRMLPFVAENNLAEFCDVFCEKTAFSINETEQIFEAAAKNNFKLKLHTDQFNSIGGVGIALKYNATSAEHLEVVNSADVEKLASSDTVAVALPGVSFFLGYQFAPARKLIDKDAILALSTDYNPGSSHIANLNFIMSLAALKMKMSIEETISAVTINAAKALNRNHKTGSIEIGKKADFAVFDTNDYADIVYEVGKNLCCMTIKNGNIIHQN